MLDSDGWRNIKAAMRAFVSSRSHVLRLHFGMGCLPGLQINEKIIVMVTFVPSSQLGLLRGTSDGPGKNIIDKNESKR